MAKRKKVKAFSELKRALTDVLRYEQGKAVNLRVTELPAPPRSLTPAEIRRIREALNASQALFARYLNVSTNTVESWEQGTRHPHDAALKLLNIAKKRPEALLEA
ncbi:MAG: helix-turn-helix domain-containing protein [Candidatus Acidiferrales bacterium]